MRKPPGENTLTRLGSENTDVSPVTVKQLVKEAVGLGVEMVIQQPFLDMNHRAATRALYHFLYNNGLIVTRSVYKVYATLSTARASDDDGDGAMTQD